ncbi:MAG: hypothetical protein WC343_05705 [Bacilli bacterium]|jgi:hypothetical protein
MARIVIPQMNTATLELKLNGEDISIQFPVDSMDGYRQAAEVIKAYREVAKKRELVKGELTEDQSAEILDQSIALMERFRDAVRIAIRDEAYNKHLKTVEDDIPFMSWVAILSYIISAYTDYFEKVTSTEGEL